MKCSKECWYCCNLCEICLQQAILGPSLQVPESKTVKFCSQECFKLYEAHPEPHSLVFSTEDQASGTIQVPDGHKEYIRLYANGNLEDGSCFITSLSLCEGDGSVDFPLGMYYLKYYLQTLNYQCHYEYFVNDTLDPLHAVNFNGSSINLFNEDECEDIKQSSIDILKGVFNRSDMSTIPQFFEILKKRKWSMENPDSFFLSDPSQLSSSASVLPDQSKDTSSHSDEQAKIQVFNVEEIIAALLAQGIDEATISELLGNIDIRNETPPITSNVSAKNDDNFEESASESRS